VDPLNIIAEPVQHAARFRGRTAKVIGGHVSRTGDFTFDHIFRHFDSPCLFGVSPLEGTPNTDSIFETASIKITQNP
jgi:hypothetical protein